MLEYNDNPEATAETIDDEGWLHTGDLGRMDARGYVTVTGRVKEMIIRGGENHFPAEIENCLLEHPDVAEVAVVGLPDEKYGELIGAFIRPTGDQLNKENASCPLSGDHVTSENTKRLGSGGCIPANWFRQNPEIRKLRDEFENGTYQEMRIVMSKVLYERDNRIGRM